MWWNAAFVTYSNEAKEESLDVPAALLRKYGAVSDQVARAMADGALRHARAQLAIAVTGIAGPGGGSAEKPVGLVYIAVADNRGSASHDTALAILAAAKCALPPWAKR